MRKKFKVILDCDDVLYQCNAYAVKILNEGHGSNFRLSDIDRWGKLGNALDVRMELFADPDFVENQPLYPGAQEFVSELSKRAEVVIATNVPPQCAGARISAIVRDFPEIHISNILIGGRKDLLVADMMLDDAPQNMQGANVRYPVLFRQPWNYNRTGLLSVSAYHEFLTLVDLIKSSEATPELVPGAFTDTPVVIVLVGPSGAGKKDLAWRMADACPKIRRITSFTTASYRKPQYFSLDYISISPERFEEMREEFFETSSYMGNLFGTRRQDIEREIQKGFIPLLVMDINGMIAMKTHFQTLAVFVKADKEQCIRDITGRLLHGMSIDEAVSRIAAIDAELKNEEFCDITITPDSDSVKTVMDILGMA